MWNSGRAPAAVQRGLSIRELGRRSGLHRIRSPRALEREAAAVHPRRDRLVGSPVQGRDSSPSENKASPLRMREPRRNQAAQVPRPKRDWLLPGADFSIGY